MPYMQCKSRHIQATSTGGTVQLTHTLSNADLWVLSAAVMAKRAATVNTSNVHINANADLEQGVAAECIEMEPGDYWQIPVPAGGSINLADYYFDPETSGDCVQIIYTQ